MDVLKMRMNLTHTERFLYSVGGEKSVKVWRETLIYLGLTQEDLDKLVEEIEESIKIEVVFPGEYPVVKVTAEGKTVMIPADSCWLRFGTGREKVIE